MNALILGVDAGNNGAKVAGLYGLDTSRTAICGWFERDIVEKFGDDDMEFEIDGRKGYYGSIAEAEDEFGGGAMFGDTKAHEDTKIRVLLAIARYIKKHRLKVYCVKIVVGQPISTHKSIEKEKIIKMLKGAHTFTVNGTHTFIDIVDVIVATEGGAAFWAQPEEGEVKLIDAGSGTVNAIAISDKKIINNKSETLDFGAETIKNKKDFEGMARGIIQNTTRLKWHKDDFVYVCGGIAEKLTPFLQSHFKNIEIMRPQFQYRDGVTFAHPIYANAIGFYTIAKGKFK